MILKLAKMAIFQKAKNGLLWSRALKFQVKNDPKTALWLFRAKNFDYRTIESLDYRTILD